METALRLLHAGLGIVLVVAHGLFFFRGLAIQARRIAPGGVDRLARSLSQALLPAAAASGLVLALAAGRELPLPHFLLGLSPIAAVPLFFFGRRLAKKRTQLPWLLPAVNLILLAAAAVTGFRPWR
jgi:hypothetical protein